MRPYFPNDKMREENDRLVEMILNAGDGVDEEDILREYASPEYLAFMESEAKRREELFKQGIVI